VNEKYSGENAAKRQRLFRLTAKLGNDDLNRKLPNGWSVATKLLHLAFWDMYCLPLIEKWEQSGFKYSPGSVDAINHGTLALSRCIPPEKIVDLVRESAEAIDRKVESISPELAAAIETAGYVHFLRRAIHRRHHLDQIEFVLK
jgi:hypothetical protein